MKRVAPDIYREKLYGDSTIMGCSFLYLFHAKPRSLLIDTGFNVASSRHRMMELLRTLEIDPKSLDVFVTHNHPDHAGLAAYLASCGATILMPEGEASTHVMLCGYYSESRGNSLLRLRQLGFSVFQSEQILANGFSPEYAYHDYPHQFPFTTISAGTKLTYGDYTLETVPLHGHTASQLGLAEHHHKWLFAGDTLARHEILILSATNDQENLLSMQRETFRLLTDAYKNYWIVSGHSNPFFGTEKPVASALRYYNHLEDRILYTLKRSGNTITAAELVRKLFRYTSPLEQEEPIKLHFRLANVLACLNDLTDVGKLIHSTEDGVWFWKYN